MVKSGVTSSNFYWLLPDKKNTAQSKLTLICFVLQKLSGWIKHFIQLLVRILGMG